MLYGYPFQPYVVGNVFYIVGVYCGGIACGCIYVVETVHILWGYVVDNTHSSYMLWVTLSCG